MKTDIEMTSDILAEVKAARVLRGKRVKITAAAVCCAAAVLCAAVFTDMETEKVSVTGVSEKTGADSVRNEYSSAAPTVPE